MKNSGATEGQSASELIDKRIAELGDWRGETLSRMRKLIKEAEPDVVEEWKWMGTTGAFKALIRAAVALNASAGKARPRPAR